jgi:lysophospholipase L1-like esterase
MRNSTLLFGALAIGGAAGLVSLWERPIAKAVGLPPPPEVIPESRQRIVLCFGDSLSAETASSPAYWRYIKPTGTMLVNGSSKGYGGQQIAAILKASKPIVEKVHPTDVVLLAGVNDIASTHTVQRVIADLQAAWDYYHAQGARVIAVKLTPWFGYTKYFGADKKTAQPFRDVTNAVNAYIDARRGMKGGPDAVVETAPMGDKNGALKKEYSAGGLHMSNAGKKALGALVAKAL